MEPGDDGAVIVDGGCLISPNMLEVISKELRLRKDATKPALPNNYFCIHCHLILLPVAYQTICGCFLCQKCAETLFCNENPLPCPANHFRFGPLKLNESVLVNLSKAIEIRDTIVICPSTGCYDKMSIENLLRNHSQECTRILTCPKACAWECLSISILQNVHFNLSADYANCCPYLVAPCPWCQNSNQKFDRDSLRIHLHEQHIDFTKPPLTISELKSLCKLDFYDGQQEKHDRRDDNINYSFEDVQLKMAVLMDEMENFPGNSQWSSSSSLSTTVYPPHRSSSTIIVSNANKNIKPEINQEYLKLLSKKCFSKINAASSPFKSYHFCQKCYNLLITAYATECGCNFCEICTNFLFSSNNPSACPVKDSKEGYCTEELLQISKNVYPNEAIKRETLRLVVKCPFNLCQCKMKVGELLYEHMDMCLYRLANNFTSPSPNSLSTSGYYSENPTELAIHQYANGNYLLPIDNFSELLKESKRTYGLAVDSLPVPSTNWNNHCPPLPSFQIRVYLNGNGEEIVGKYLSVFFILLPGEFDDDISWPIKVQIQLKTYENKPLKHDGNGFCTLQINRESQNEAYGNPKFAKYDKKFASQFVFNDNLTMRIKFEV